MEKAARFASRLAHKHVLRLCERRFLHLPVANAGSTHTQALSGSVHKGMDSMQVQIPATLRHIVSVADAVSKLRSTTANFTNFRHKTHLHSALDRT
jgi:hypothetical protein